MSLKKVDLKLKLQSRKKINEKCGKLFNCQNIWLQNQPQPAGNLQHQQKTKHKR